MSTKIKALGYTVVAVVIPLVFVTIFVIWPSETFFIAFAILMIIGCLTLAAVVVYLIIMCLLDIYDFFYRTIDPDCTGHRVYRIARLQGTERHRVVAGPGLYKD